MFEGNPIHFIYIRIAYVFSVYRFGMPSYIYGNLWVNY